MSRPFGNTRIIRFFDPSFGSQKDAILGKLKGGSGNALHPTLLDVKYRNCDASVRSLVVVPDIYHSSLGIHRPKLFIKDSAY